MFLVTLLPVSRDKRSLRCKMGQNTKLICARCHKSCHRAFKGNHTILHKVFFVTCFFIVFVYSLDYCSGSMLNCFQNLYFWEPRICLLAIAFIHVNACLMAAVVLINLKQHHPSSYRKNGFLV